MLTVKPAPGLVMGEVCPKGTNNECLNAKKTMELSSGQTENNEQPMNNFERANLLHFNF